MHTSALLLRQVRRAILVAFVLGGFSALLQLALPLAVLHAIDIALPARSLETLLLLAAVAFAALVALMCLSTARARILLRAGLWLDHTLGAHTLESGLRNNAEPRALSEDALAIAGMRKALSDGTALALLDLPWLIVLSGVFALLDWRLAVVAVAATLLLVLRMASGRRALTSLARRSGTAAQRADEWWHSVTRMTGLDRLPVSAAQQWERLNRDHVTSAYALGARISTLGDFAQLVRAAAQVGMLALGVWLAMSGDVTIGVLVASMMLLWRMLEPMERLLATLPDVVASRDAWRHLVNIARTERAAPEDKHSAPPRLMIGGPLAAALAAVTLFFAVGAGLAAFTSVGQLAVLAGAPLFETHVTSVYPTRSGISARVVVSEGARVEKGDLLATLDTRALDGRISTLKLRASTVQIELRALNEDAAALVAKGAPALRNRAPLEKLEAKIADVGRQGRDLAQSIAQAEQELALSRIVSPAAGRVVGLTARPGMPLEIDTPLATIVAADASLLSRLLAPFHPLPQQDARNPESVPQHVASLLKSGS